MPLRIARVYLSRLSAHRRVVLAIGVVAVGVAGMLAWRAAPSQPAAVPDPVPAAETSDPPPAPTVLVFVSGAVAHPGLYHLTATARIADALAAAGGTTADADPSRLPNESSRVHDGRQVNVPFLRSGSSGGRAAAAKVDLNSASLEELRSLPEMPPGAAEAIVDHRSRWGPFHSVADLRNDLGLDRDTVSSLARVVKVTRPP